MQGMHQIDRRPRGGDFAFWLHLFALMAFWGGPARLRRPTREDKEAIFRCQRYRNAAAERHQATATGFPRFFPTRSSITANMKMMPASAGMIVRPVMRRRWMSCGVG